MQADGFAYLIQLSFVLQINGVLHFFFPKESDFRKLTQQQELKKTDAARKTTSACVNPRITSLALFSVSNHRGSVRTSGPFDYLHVLDLQHRHTLKITIPMMMIARMMASTISVGSVASRSAAYTTPKIRPSVAPKRTAIKQRTFEEHQQKSPFCEDSPCA